MVWSTAQRTLKPRIDDETTKLDDKTPLNWHNLDKELGRITFLALRQTELHKLCKLGFTYSFSSPNGAIDLVYRWSQ
ncbi:hypothetical protein ACP70R_003673 [Stipagrostis hirtigluma subsp. patula]